jgi:hypothetical protein
MHIEIYSKDKQELVMRIEKKGDFKIKSIAMSDEYIVYSDC